MYIAHEIYKRIVEEVPDHPPEIGGILGARNGVICYVVFDCGTQRENMGKCYYTPNVEYLNKCIADWEVRGIDFYGVFHTHFFSVSTLSEGDRQYIEKIMRAMPDVKKKLYFPVVVLPERKMVAYMCRRNKGKIKITETRIHLVKTLQL